ncbi:MAG: MBOAT family O-acyltransferase [Chitinophagaceae bacterium]
MLFNSAEYAVFLILIFFIYWFPLRSSMRMQNFVLLVSSYVFYGWWDYRFVFLLAFSTFLDYYTGLKIEQATTQRMRKAWLVLSVGINLGFLGFFKYYNFFIDSFASLLGQLGLQPNIWTLNIILPVGISFYTFHGLSYVFDIYNKRVKPTANFVDYAVFVSFFPLLVAGPIERATHLLPQVQAPRKFDYAKAVDGLRQILWGLFKKIVIADTCAEYANTIFNHYGDYNGSTLLLGAVFFAFQIYGDFSGYSDIALGSARLLGFDLLKNFNYPYFSRDIAEFWRRWHISLSSWFRDYLYFPLGGSRGGAWMRIRNTFIIFLVSGFWHGANFTFIAWGFLNALYFLPLLVMNKNRSNLDIVAQGRTLPSIREAISMLVTFVLVVLAWVFFRSPTIQDALHYLGGIFSPDLLQMPQVLPKMVLLLIAFFMLIEWIGRERHFALAGIGLKWKRPLRWGFYCLLALLILSYTGKEQQFIYFQF